ncbi:ATP-binding protein [Kytococcus schroeteri]|uniref:ATP-binding protein n=1 Tax=Kytococcus schroeteri TaxID=138300 RepID=A0A2I1P8Y4_9MICO|nr:MULTISPECIES: ATP-binding protein [Kytococcus]OFS13070.1 ATPase [Kytococcus sp. HMSC28H12]PKZ41096.1 ATP-binding protein [Kytococcus schroeteri]
MDPITNPYAPGAGQRPPELAGRDEYLRQFDVVLERIRRGRPDRSVLLTGLRGVGKTVLLNALRGQAVRANWGTGKLEARPDQSLRRPLASALHTAVRELGHPQQEDVDHVLGVIKAFAQRDAPANAKLRDRWNPGIDAPAVSGRADSGDIEIDLVELLTDVGGLAADVGKGVGIFIDEMQDLGPDDVSAVCAAFHEIGQQALPVLVVGAGLPHLPAVLSASKSYSERLFRYHRIDRLDRGEAARALQAPAADEGAEWEDEALAAMYAATGGYPYFIQAYGKEVWDMAPESPITAEDVRVAAPMAESELAVGFFGSRYERATPGEREYLRAMAEAAVTVAEQEVAAQADAAESPDPLTRAEEVEAVPTSVVAEVLGRKPQSLSPARDALMKKGLIYAPERGKIAFTVPHFGRYLRNSQ